MAAPISPHSTTTQHLLTPDYKKQKRVIDLFDKNLLPGEYA
ncbi:MAG TPA: hypothetical protein VGE32_14900 [Cellvibrio sp.]